MTPPRSGRCTVCGEPLRSAGGRYWITAHPDGVHEGCRPWEAEPFPFASDLEELRRSAGTLRSAWCLVVRQGRWLAWASRRWPAGARRLASQWLDRKEQLRHRLAGLRDRIGLR